MSQTIPFSLEVYKYYAALMRGGEPVREPQAEPGLGGLLFWGGELDSVGRALALAGSVAGAATLMASADAIQQKQAIRDGVVNFLVTSLDEALRILKNEIRKKETVAVCVAATLESIEREMAERGVRPDLTREGVVDAAKQRNHVAKGDLERDPMGVDALVIWKVDASPAVWLPKLDAIGLDCLEPEDLVARRWVRLAGRTLGRLGHDGHGLLSTREFGARFVERVRARGEIKVRGQIEIGFQGATDQIGFGPAWRDQSE